MAVGTDGILVGRLSADTKPFVSSIQEAIKSLSALGQNVNSSVVRHVKDATDSLNNMGKAAENLGNKMKTSMKMDQGADALKLMKQAFKELTTAQNEYLKAYRSGNGSGMSYFSEQAVEAKKLIQFSKEYADMLNRHGSISSDTYKKMQTAYHQYETSVLEGEKKVSSEMRKTYDEYDKKAAAAQKAADAAQKAAAKEAQAYQTDQINKAKNALKDLTDGINKYNQAKKQGNTDAMNFYQNQINQANSVLTLTKQNIDNLGLEEETRNKILKIIQDSTLAMNGFNNAQNQGQTYLKNLSDSWTRIYSVLRMITGISLVKIFRDATTYIKEMDAALVDVSVITGQTTAQTRELGDTYRKMASDLQVSSVDIAKSAATIYRQGISDANEVQAVVQGAVKFGAVTGQTAAAAIQSMTASMQNFRKEGEDIGVFVEHIGDVWSYMGDSVATTGAEISVAMDKTAASLSTVGVEFEQASAMAAIMLARTQQAGQVIGTQLNSIASRYMKITSKGYASVTSDDEGEALNFNDVSKALAKAGIEMYDTATKTFKPMWDVLKELASGWDELDEATQRYIATQIGSTRGMNYFLTLMNNFDDVLGLAEGSFNDVMDTKYDAWLEGVTAAQNNLTNSMENLYSKIGSGILKDFYNGAASIVDGFTDATAAIGGFNIKAVAGIAALFGIASGISKIITTIQAASSVQGFLSMLTGGQIGLIIAGVAAALTAIGAVVNEITKSRSAERLQEIQEAMKLNEQDISKWDTIKLQLEDLGDKTTYTAEEMQAFDNIRKSIVESSPSLVAVYGEEGEAIKDYAEAYDIVVNKQKEALRYRQALLEQGYRDTMYGDGKKGDTSFRSQAGSFFYSSKDYTSLNDYTGLSAYDRDLIMFGNEDFSSSSLFALRQYMKAVDDYINSSEYDELSKKEVDALDANYERLKNALLIKEAEWGSLVAEFVPQMFGMLTQDQAAVVAENDASDLFNSMFEGLLSQYNPNTFDMSAIEGWAKDISQIFIDILMNGVSEESLLSIYNSGKELHGLGVNVAFLNPLIAAYNQMVTGIKDYVVDGEGKTELLQAIHDGVPLSIIEAFNEGVAGITAQDLSGDEFNKAVAELVNDLFKDYITEPIKVSIPIEFVDPTIQESDIEITEENYDQMMKEMLALNAKYSSMSNETFFLDEETQNKEIARLEALSNALDEYERARREKQNPDNYSYEELQTLYDDYTKLIKLRTQLEEAQNNNDASGIFGISGLSDYVDLDQARTAEDALKEVNSQIDNIRENYGGVFGVLGVDISEQAEETKSAIEQYNEAIVKADALRDTYSTLKESEGEFGGGLDEIKTDDLIELGKSYGYLSDSIAHFLETGDSSQLIERMEKLIQYQDWQDAAKDIQLMTEAIQKLGSGDYDNAYLDSLISTYDELIDMSPEQMIEWMQGRLPGLISQWQDYAEQIGQTVKSTDNLRKAYRDAVEAEADTRSEEGKIVDSIHKGNTVELEDLMKLRTRYEGLDKYIIAYINALDTLREARLDGIDVAGAEADVQERANALYEAYLNMAANERAGSVHVSKNELAMEYYNRAVTYSELLEEMNSLAEQGATSTASMADKMVKAGFTTGFYGLDEAIVMVTNHLAGYIAGFEEASGLTWDTEKQTSIAENLTEAFKTSPSEAEILQMLKDGANAEMIGEDVLKQLGQERRELQRLIEDFAETGDSSGLISALESIVNWDGFNTALNQIDLLRKALSMDGEYDIDTMTKLMDTWGDQLTTDNVEDWADIIRGILAGLIGDWQSYADAVNVALSGGSDVSGEYKEKTDSRSETKKARDKLANGERLTASELASMTGAFDGYEKLADSALEYAKAIDTVSEFEANGDTSSREYTAALEAEAAAVKALGEAYDNAELNKRISEGNITKSDLTSQIYTRAADYENLLDKLTGMKNEGYSTTASASSEMEKMGLPSFLNIDTAIRMVTNHLEGLISLYEEASGLKWDVPTEEESIFDNLTKAFEEKEDISDLLEMIQSGKSAEEIGEALLESVGKEYADEYEGITQAILDFAEGKEGADEALIQILQSIMGSGEFFDAMGEMQNIIDAMNMLTEGDYDADDLEKLFGLFPELKDSDPAEWMDILSGKLETLTGRWYALAKALGVTIPQYKSLAEQTKELTDTRSDSEKAVDKLAKGEKLNAKELAAIGKQYPNMLKYVNDYANGLDDGATLMNKLSKEIAKSKIAAWSKDVKSAVKELSKAKVGTIEYNEAMRELGEAFNFNGLIDGTEFAKQNLDLIAKAADGSTEAFMRLQEAAFIEVIGSSSADFSAVQNGLYATEAEAINAMNALQAAGMGTVEYITLPVDATEMVAVPDGLGGFKLHPQTIKANTTVAVWKPSKSAPTTSTKKSSGGSKSGGGGGGKTGAGNYASRKTQKNLDKADSMVNVFNPNLNIIRLKENYHSQRGETASLASYIQLEAEYLKRQNSIILSEMRYLEDEAHRYIGIMDSARDGSSKFTKAQVDYTALAEKLDDYNSTLIKNKTRIAEITQELRDYQEQMRQTTITIQDTIRETIQARIDYQRSIRDATVDMEDTIREAIEARYEREKDLAIETLEKKRDAIQQEIDSIDKLIKEREKLLEKEEDENEIAELQAKIARIAADPTRQKELMELQEELAEKQKDLAMKRWKEDLQAQKDLLTQQQTEIDEGIDKIEEDYENLLDNPKQIIAEMEAVMSEADDMIVLWLSKNMDEFTTYTQNKQDQVKESWRETLDMMRGYTETYNSQIAQIMRWSDTDIMAWLSNMDPTFATSTQEQKESMLYNWALMLEDWHVQDTEAVRNIDPYVDPFWVTSTGIENHETHSGSYNRLFERMATGDVDSYLWDYINDAASLMSHINVPGLTSINTSDMSGNTGEVTVGTINVNVESLNEDQDYQELARRIGEALNEELRNTGTVGGLKL